MKITKCSAVCVEIDGTMFCLCFVAAAHQSAPIFFRFVHNVFCKHV